MSDGLEFAAAFVNPPFPEHGRLASCLALTGDDVLLLCGVVGGGLLVTWLVLQLVLRETARFSRNFPRQDATSDSATQGDASEALATQARHQESHEQALRSGHDVHGHAPVCDEPGLHVHPDGCMHAGGAELDAGGNTGDDGGR